jgi:DNA-binding CsgD family transcriptional regulator
MDVAPADLVVGRTEPRTVLVRLVAELAEGKGGIGWLRGEPGIGKSTLVDLLAATAVRAGCAVFRRAGDELTEAFPLRLMADALQVSGRSADPSRVAIAELLRGETGGSGAVDPVLAASERMLELVDRLCARGPVLLIAEDLHWADEPSLLVLSRLAHAVDQIPLLLLGTCRPVPYRVKVARLEELVVEHGGTVRELGPLDDAEVLQMAERITGSSLGPALRAELSRAGGNPLYVRELVDALVRDDLVELADGVAEVGGDAGRTPDSLTTAIGRRLRFLTDATAKTLRMAALLGNEFDPGELGLVTGQPIAELLSALDEAVAAGVVRDAGPRLTFRHELIRQVMREQTPTSVRVGLHRHIARHLAEAGAGMDVVARHLLAVPGALDGWVPGWLAEVPEPMLSVAPKVSTELLTRVVGASDAAGPHGETLAARLAQVQFWLGDDEQASRIAKEVARRSTDVRLAASMRILVLRASGRMGRPEDALPIVEAIGEEPDTPLVWRARLGAWSAVILAHVGQTDRAMVGARAALRDGEQSGDPLAVAYARHALALLSDAPSVLAHLDAALAVLGDDPESQDLRMLLLGNLLTYLAVFGQWTRIETELPRALVLAERVGTFRAAALLGSAAEASYVHGNWDDAVIHLASIDAQFLDHRANMNARSLSALIALRRGDRDGAHAQLAMAGLTVPVASSYVGFPSNWRLSTAWALQAEAEGDLHRALALMNAWLTERALPGQQTRHELLPYLLRLALAVGDIETARAAVAASRADAEADPVAARTIAARCCQAMLDGDADGLLAAAEEFREHGWPLQVSFALEEAAVLLAEAGDTRRARAAFTDVVRLYADLGASWDLRRTEARLRPYGIRRGPRSPHRRASTGWEALTPAELRIANLVAQGLSNPDIATELFLSRGTVQTHVSNILLKLKLQSRVGVVHEVARRAVAGTG